MLKLEQWRKNAKLLMSIKRLLQVFLEFIIRHKWMLKSFSINTKKQLKMESRIAHKNHLKDPRLRQPEHVVSNDFNRKLVLWKNQEKLLKHRKNDLQCVVLRLETLFSYLKRQAMGYEHDSAKKEVVKETWASFTTCETLLHLLRKLL